jgi:hypothetical protein
MHSQSSLQEHTPTSRGELPDVALVEITELRSFDSAEDDKV